MHQLEFDLPSPGKAVYQQLIECLHRHKEQRRQVMELALTPDLHSLLMDYLFSATKTVETDHKGRTMFMGKRLYRIRNHEDGDGRLALFYTQMGVYSEKISF